MRVRVLVRVINGTLFVMMGAFDKLFILITSLALIFHWRYCSAF